MASTEKSEPDEATHARYVENYLECLENMPGELQVLVSRMLDLDASFLKYDRQLDEQKEVLQRNNLDAAGRSRVFALMVPLLAHMHEIGDDKLQLVQHIHDIVEKNARQLDIDFKNLRPKIEQENNEPLNGSAIKETNGSNNQSTKITIPVNNEKITRRGRRTRTETTETAPDSSVLSENQSSNLPSTSNSSQKKTNAVSNAGRKKKRKVAIQQNQSRDDSPSDDPDEPLYCICNQISYGKMILCDNDSCSLEWFHFNCVSLTTKPKGKWYCPQCRGSKPNIMKSKAQFR